VLCDAGFEQNRHAFQSDFILTNKSRIRSITLHQEFEADQVLLGSIMHEDTIAHSGVDFDVPATVRQHEVREELVQTKTIGGLTILRCDQSDRPKS